MKALNNNLPRCTRAICIRFDRFCCFRILSSCRQAYHGRSPCDCETTCFPIYTSQTFIRKAQFGHQKMCISQPPTLKPLTCRIDFTLWPSVTNSLSHNRATWNLACSKCHGKNQDSSEMIPASIALSTAQSYGKHNI